MCKCGGHKKIPDPIPEEFTMSEMLINMKKHIKECDCLLQCKFVLYNKLFSEFEDGELYATTFPAGNKLN